MSMVFVKTIVLSITVLIMLLSLVALFTVSVASRTQAGDALRRGFHIKVS